MPVLTAMTVPPVLCKFGIKTSDEVSYVSLKTGLHFRVGLAAVY
jgi:hypothetical protein